MKERRFYCLGCEKRNMTQAQYLRHRVQVHNDTLIEACEKIRKAKNKKETRI